MKILVPILIWFATCFLGFAGLAACTRESNFEPRFPESQSLKHYHIGSYSSKRLDDDAKEIPGTQFQSNVTWTWSKRESGYRMTRVLDSMSARGYHKNSLPHELEYKANLTMDFDGQGKLVAIAGYDSLPDLLRRIPQQKEEWRAELLKQSDTAQFKARWRDFWRLFRFLPQGKPLVRNQVLDVTLLNANLETFRVDSAFFRGWQPRLRRHCLEMELRYQRQDSLPLLREQFLNSSNANRKLRNFKPSIAKVQGTWMISVDAETGLPCHWSHTEIGDLDYTDPVTKSIMPVQLIGYEEDVIHF